MVIDELVWVEAAHSSIACLARSQVPDEPLLIDVLDRCWPSKASISLVISDTNRQSLFRGTAKLALLEGARGSTLKDVSLSSRQIRVSQPSLSTAQRLHSERKVCES